MTFLFIVILILILYSGMYKNYMSLRESRKQLQSYEQYLPIIEDLIDQVRMRQHDYNNELQAISMLPISYTDYDSLAAALSNELDTSCNDHVIKNSYLLRINMKLIAGFLFSKMNLAQEHNINLDIDVKNSTLTSKAAEFELLDVMSILVDNAFDATEDGGMIKVIIDSDGKTTTVETFNAGSQLTAEMRKNFFAKGYSTKPLKDGAYSRGIGLYKLKQLTSKYHGEILLDNQTVDGQNCIHFVVSI
jgi:two-component system sensor histidine kinase AgrC